MELYNTKHSYWLGAPWDDHPSGVSRLLFEASLLSASPLTFCTHHMAVKCSALAASWFSSPITIIYAKPYSTTKIPTSKACSRAALQLPTIDSFIIMSGITDEAAIEGHDLIHNAELEEQKAHGKDAMTTDDYEEHEESQPQGQQRQEPGAQPGMDKVQVKEGS